MDLDLSLAQLVIQEKARVFATEHIAPVATRNDREEIFPRNILNELAPTGLMAPTLPYEMGGLGADFIGEALVFEEIGKVCSSVSDVHLSDEQRLGEVGEGFRIAMSAVDNGRYGLAAGCVRQAQACLDACITYSKERESFGKPIASHQLVQEMLVEMALQVETARLLVYQAWYLKNKGVKNICQTSLAKLHASEVAVNVARTTDELPRSKLRGMYPNRFKVEEGRVVSVVDCRQAEELRDIVPNIENAANIAEIGVGLNPMCRRNGDFEGEKKRRGNVYIAIRDNIFYSGDVHSAAHMDMVIYSPTVKLDDRIVVDRGNVQLTSH
ncbi:MAG: acyl-CoA dehydrogenase family protein [Chloroflexota bacterium]